MANNTAALSKREKIALYLIMFAIKIINPTGYEHQISQLKDAVEGEL